MAGHKLEFQTLRAKNFRSIGNVMLEIDYKGSPTTLISSEANGSGKSNLAVWALYFVLFGEPYSSSCKIAGLVNSRSNKDCLVELDFNTLGSKWTVRRGYKPAVFEIYQDGVLIESEAAKSDYQKFLQSKIGMDKKTFSNIVALGVSRFVPFIEMSSADRRVFVEQMLDLVVISQMNAVTKDKVKALKKQMEQVNYEINICESKLSGHVRTKTILETQKQARLESSAGEIQMMQDDLDKQEKMIKLAEDKINNKLAELHDGAEVKLRQSQDMLNRFKNKIKDLNTQIATIESVDICSECKQEVHDSHKSVIKATVQAEIDKLSTPMLKLEHEVNRGLQMVDSNNAVNAEVQRIQSLLISTKTNAKNITSNINKLKQQLESSNEDELILTEDAAIAEKREEIQSKTELMNSISNSENAHNHLLQILKDDGIKASIVQQYIPFLNTTINQILDKLNLFIQIKIDSEFNIEMFAPDRKGQTLGNLSTGQLRRIDLAVMLAWREVAKSKASVDANILILDEILENLSATGVEQFMEMWEVMGSDTNLIVISQRPAEFSQYFDREIKYALKDGMTIEVN